METKKRMLHRKVIYKKIKIKKEKMSMMTIILTNIALLTTVIRGIINRGMMMDLDRSTMVEGKETIIEEIRIKIGHFLKDMTSIKRRGNIIINKISITTKHTIDLIMKFRTKILVLRKLADLKDVIITTVSKPEAERKLRVTIEIINDHIL